MLKSAVARVCCLFLLAMTLGSCLDSDEVETGEAAQPLVTGAPLIIATSINAPISNGRYQLLQGKSYTVTVIVDAGTVNRTIGLEANDSMTASMIGYQSRVETVKAYTGQYVYEFPLAASTVGSYQVAFLLRDKGVAGSPIYQSGVGVAVTVSSAYAAPRISSTTINAPILDGRYVLYAGETYQVTVRVSMSNVTYLARVEPYIAPGWLALSPSMSPPSDLPPSTMTRYGSDQLFVFTIHPTLTSTPEGQLAFQLRDPVTGNAFAAAPGISVIVRAPEAPRIASTTILDRGVAVTPRAGQYVLTIGRRYDVVVRVVPGTGVMNAAAELRNPSTIESMNVHNILGDFVVITQPTDFRFTLTPTDVGVYTVAFQVRDAPPSDMDHPGTGDAYNSDAGVQIVAADPEAPNVGALHGKVTIPGGGSVVDNSEIRVSLDYAAGIQLDASGSYSFPSVSPGTHRLYVWSLSTDPQRSYTPTTVINVKVPAPGMRVDVDLEEPFVRMSTAGMPYQRFIDYSRGRTLFHVVRVNKTSDRLEILPSNSGGYETAEQITSRLASYAGPDPGVAINGGYFDFVDTMDPTRCATGRFSYVALGYAYYDQPAYSCEYNRAYPIQYGPTLGISNSSGLQVNRIVNKSFRYDTADWSWNGTSFLWDDDRNYASDVNYALQTETFLVRPPANGECWPGMVSASNTCVIVSPLDPMLLQNQYWARTAVGLDTNGNLVMVVADGEGLTGRQGANYSQLAQLFARHLGVTVAMPLDSGGSTQMAIFSERAQPPRYRWVNALTGENNNPPDGRVLNYVIASPAN